MQAQADQLQTVAVSVPLWIPMAVLAAIAIGIIWLVTWLRGRRE